MGCIVCATRGGAGSRAVQLRAVDYASQGDHELVFLYIIDLTTLDTDDEKLRAAVRSELVWIGQALLLVAQNRADNAGITSDIVIREGSLRKVMCSFLKERNADKLFLGAPRDTTSTTFGDDLIEQFAQEIMDDCGVKVEIVRPESDVVTERERLSADL